MADFCNQCAKDLGFKPGDLTGITTSEDWTNGLAVRVLCEDCGVTLVDPEGNCITNCAKHYKKEIPGFDTANKDLSVFGISRYPDKD